MNQYSFILSSVRALIVRPSPFAQQLTEAIKQQGGYAYALPMQKIIPTATNLIIEQLNTNLKIDRIIVTSRFAARCAIPALQYDWQQFNSIKKWYCLGANTSIELNKFGINASYPNSGITSENLLQLKDFSLKNIRKQNILIIKGNNGRKTLYNTLTHRQANVVSLESYSREPLCYCQQATTTLIQKHNFNCIFCGNHEALKNLCNFLPMSYRNKYILILPSLRQVNLAIKLGFINSCYINGMSNNNIIAKLYEQQNLLRLKNETK
jgi:uroporphyrinogen-III synthase